MLSVTYLKILIGLHYYLKNVKNIQDNNDFLMKFMKLLVININPNPIKIKYISETLEIFDVIIYSCQATTYKQLFNIL